MIKTPHLQTIAVDRRRGGERCGDGGEPPSERRAGEWRAGGAAPDIIFTSDTFMREAEAWLRENCRGKWHVVLDKVERAMLKGGAAIHFEHEDDFKRFREMLSGGPPPDGTRSRGTKS